MSIILQRDIKNGAPDPLIEALNGDTRNDFLIYCAGVFPRLMTRVEALEKQVGELSKLPLEIQKLQVENTKLKKIVEGRRI